MPEWIHTLTVDASYDPARRVTGIGIVIQECVAREGRGRVLEQIAEAHPDADPGSGEALAILRALEIAQDRALVRIKVRSDYNWLRRSLRELHRLGELSQRGPLHDAILRLARSFQYADFGYVPRRKNQTAHRLARQGRFLPIGAVASTTSTTGSAGVQRAVAFERRLPSLPRSSVRS